MVTAVFITIFILILPLIFSVYFYYDNDNKRVYFAVFIFGYFKILSGYIKGRIKGGIYIHLSEKRAIIVRLSALKNIGNGPNFLKVISVNSLYYLIDVGTQYVWLLTYFSVLVKNTHAFASIFDSLGYYFNLFADLNVYQEEIGLKSIKFKLKLSFNLIGIIILFITNYISKGIKNAKRKKIKS